MGRLGIKTRLNAATLRLSSLPPRERYCWLTLMLVCLGGFVTGIIMLIVSSHNFYTWWFFTLISGWVGVMGVIWKATRSYTTDRTVDNNTKRLDQHYEELVKRYWREH